MAVKILVVDDSVTMRKIVEMTFAAEDAQVLAVDGADAALGKLDEFAPDAVLADVSMSPDAYDLARSVKSRKPNVAVIALSSQHTPYDAAKGTASGVDDNVVKPFDTTQLINKVTEVLQKPRVQPGGATAATAPAAAAAPAATAARAPAAAAAAPVASAGGAPREMKRTMAFGMPLSPVANPVGAVQGGPAIAPTPQPAPAAPAPAPAASAGPVVPKPSAAAPAAAVPAARAPAVASPAPAQAASSTVAAAVAGTGLAGKLAQLGLTKDQVDGVLALSREVVEQVVWEVVPELAEALIKEEIKRLTAA